MKPMKCKSVTTTDHHIFGTTLVFSLGTKLNPKPTAVSQLYKHDSGFISRNNFFKC